MPFRKSLNCALRPVALMGLAGMLLGCVAPADPAQPFRPSYQGVETRRIDQDLVNFVVRMQGARGPEDVAAYAKCAAAQYTLIRGFGFARHVRTNVEDRDGVWLGDAVYTISAALPAGVSQIDAEVVVENCRRQGIPTV